MWHHLWGNKQGLSVLFKTFSGCFPYTLLPVGLMYKLSSPQTHHEFPSRPLTGQTISCTRAPAARWGWPSGRRVRYSGMEPPLFFIGTPGSQATTRSSRMQNLASSFTLLCPTSTCSSSDTATASGRRHCSGWQVSRAQHASHQCLCPIYLYSI